MSQAEPTPNEKRRSRAPRTPEAQQARGVLWASLALSAMTTAVTITAFVASSPDLPSEYIAALLPAGAAAIGLVSAWLSYRQRTTAAVYVLSGVVLLTIIIQGVLTEGYGLLFGMTAFVSVSALAALGASQRMKAPLSIAGLLVGVSAVLLDQFGPPGRVTGSERFQSLGPIPIVILLILYILLTVRLFPGYSLRAKLIINSVGIAAIFTSVLTVFSNYNAAQGLTQAANRMLITAAQQTAHVLDHFWEELGETLQNDAASNSISSFLSRSAESQVSPEERQGVLDELRVLRSESQADLYFLLDRQGAVKLNTSDIASELYPRYLNLNEMDPDSFERVLLTGKTYFSPVIFPPVRGQEPYFYAAARVLDVQKLPVGVLVGRYPAYILQELISQEVGLAGEASFPVLLDEKYLRLAHGNIPELIYRLVAPLGDGEIAALQQKRLLPETSAAILSTNLPAFAAGMDNRSKLSYFTTAETADESASVLYAAAVTTLEARSWYIVYMQPQSVFLAPIKNQARTNIVLALVIAAASSLIAIAVAQIISRPLARLTEVVERISAGDLNAQAEITTQDEIGKLATGFNTMTAQLRHTLEDLEQRVADRTVELEAASETMLKRAAQLQLVADIAHTIASIQEMEKLLTVVPQQISDRFGYYHVGIFLLDKNEEYAILQGANSEGGQRMLERGHRLRVGQTGIVGYVTANRQPRIALDVGRDAVYFDNPDLPLTRSEIALPLEVGEQILGALDVQSTLPAAFNDDDVALLSTLANQVAVAVQNARLFSETRQTLAELQIAQRQYLQQEWSRLAADRQVHGVEFQLGKIKELSAGVERDWHALQDGGISIEPVGASSAHQPAEQGQLVVPLMLRGQVIGALNLESHENRHAWSDEEINLVRSVADQVSLALENARLVEETQRSAAQERLVSDISDKLYRSVDLDLLIQTAVREISSALGVTDILVQLAPPSELQQS